MTSKNRSVQQAAGTKECRCALRQIMAPMMTAGLACMLQQHVLNAAQVHAPARMLCVSTHAACHAWRAVRSAKRCSRDV